MILKQIKLFSAPGSLHSFPWPRGALTSALCMAHSCSPNRTQLKCHLLGEVLTPNPASIIFCLTILYVTFRALAAMYNLPMCS